MEHPSSKSHADLKYHNLHLVYSTIKNQGPISRATLAKRTGLSATSMTRIIGDLINCGLLDENPAGVVSGLGRPSKLIDIKQDAAYCLCMDLSVDRSRVALVDLNNKTQVYREILTPAGRSFEQIAAELADVLEALCEEGGVARAKVAYCGVSVPGHVLYDAGKIAASAQFDWTNVHAAEILQSTLGIPAFVENDCKAALIGEVALLPVQRQHMANMVYMKLGWAGVGAAAIVDGSILRGSRNAAGEIGNFLSSANDAQKHGRQRHSFESIMSESAVIAQAQELNPMYGSMQSIAKGLAANDAALSRLIDRVCEYVAIAINDLSCAYNPDTIVLDGNLITNCGNCYARIETNLQDKMLSSIHPNLKVTIAKKGTNAGLFGIACIAIGRTASRLIRCMNNKAQP